MSLFVVVLGKHDHHKHFHPIHQSPPITSHITHGSAVPLSSLLDLRRRSVEIMLP
jgi:hypothetical protein